MDTRGIQLSEAPVWAGCNLQATEEGFEKSRLLPAARGTGCLLVCVRVCDHIRVSLFLCVCECVHVCVRTGGRHASV